MKKTSLFFILILSVFFSYNTAFGATVYNQSYTGTNYDISDGTSPNYYRKFPGFVSMGNPPTANEITTANYNMIRLKVISTDITSCGNLMNTFHAYRHSDGSGYITFSSCSYHDGYVDLNIATPVSNIFYLTLPLVNLAGTNHLVLDGSPSNLGAVVDGYNTNYLPGGWAFSLCHNSACDGDEFGPPDTSSGIFDFSPVNGAVVNTTGTGDVPFSFKYYLSSSNDPSGVDDVCIRGNRTDAPGDFEYCTGSAVYDSETTVSHTITGLTVDSQWEWRIYFKRPGFLVDEFQTVIRGTTTIFISRFTIDLTATQIYDAYTTCSITDIAGCLQNALVYLFYPSPGALSSFNDLYDTFKNKPPFGYISAVQTSLSSINDTETSAFTLQSMPILNTYIFTPIRTALIWVLWLAFLFIFYRRLSNIHL